MTTPMREVLVATLADELGAAVDTADSDMDDGWLTAHVALRTVEWVLDAAGHPDLALSVCTHDNVSALAKLHQSHEFASFDDDALDWPLPVTSYADMIEGVLGVDLASLPVEGELSAPARFAAPNEEVLVRAIE